MTPEPQPTVFLLNSQTPRYVPYLVVRANGDSATLVTAIRREVQAVDKTLALTAIKSMEGYLSESVARPRLYATLLSAFAVLALALSAIGLYGLMAYIVRQRTQEIGIRMALGASRRDILKLVVSRSLLLSLTGVGFGLVGALVLTRLLASLLFSVSPTDPFTFAVISVLLVGVAMLACWIPTRRATAIDPSVAIRYQ